MYLSAVIHGLDAKANRSKRPDTGGAERDGPASTARLSLLVVSMDVSSGLAMYSDGGFARAFASRRFALAPPTSARGWPWQSVAFGWRDSWCRKGLGVLAQPRSLAKHFEGQRRLQRQHKSASFESLDLVRDRHIQADGRLMLHVDLAERAHRARRFEGGHRRRRPDRGDPVTAEQMRALFGCELLPAVQFKASDDEKDGQGGGDATPTGLQVASREWRTKHRIREVRNHGAGTDRADDLVGKPLSRHTLITARTALCTDSGRPRGRRLVHCVLTCVGSVRDRFSPAHTGVTSRLQLRPFPVE